ncbi:MAG: sugar transferase [Anaerolineae bacterium]|nr:sugar transferase [Anaerolineae bacterium]
MNLVIINQQPQVFPYRRFYQAAKRLLDIALVFITLPLTLPLIALCALAIRLDSPGPVFFVQERIGKGGQAFKIFKFRTMQHNLDDSFHRAFMKAFVHGKIDGNSGPKTELDLNNLQVETKKEENSFRRSFMKVFVNSKEALQVENDTVFKPVKASQITRMGRILRKTSLDELPQLLNVLMGEMSLVGPRPNVRWEVEEYQPWHHERLEVLPGITGLAQVRGRSGISFDRIVEYDVEYIEKQSLAEDFRILWLTFSTVLTGKGAE